MNLLNDCNEAECNAIEENPSYPRQRAGKLNTLRNATIQAMSNLLSANIDSGLMHSIGLYLIIFVLLYDCLFYFNLNIMLFSFLDLGYNRDLQTRAAFMEVLTKILQQGTEFDTLAETVLADRYFLYSFLLCQYNFSCD